MAINQLLNARDVLSTTIFGKDLGAVPDWVLEALTGLLSDIKPQTPKTTSNP